ncbi:MAG TPA: 50S ribosomal protein L13 [Gammaproteobacteria bacterium]|nr:50S ribosomal protein L13 [Gammaproteobacteria bacterium]MEC8010494.1 50S ribosomal protein L13 [Pseudomonadota bacterium]HCK93781.1 50S ribosomal protein L13 [Gammaproteobacteria bacterium]|tara:strand:- start:3175 stop:3606 length:432 start_codon:yes stop_codon:yes gene_type:complete
MKTFSAKPSDIKRKWLILDAEGKTLGRISTEIARVLRGKHKPEYTPHMDLGDFVIVVNASKVRITGNKFNDKMYYRHTGYPGGIRGMNFKKLVAEHPDRVIELAVKGMLPKNALGRAMYRKLKVYAGAEHPHAAQQPEEMKIA